MVARAGIAAAMKPVDIFSLLILATIAAALAFVCGAQ